MLKLWKGTYCQNNIDECSPFLLKDMDKATDRLSRAINAREKIILYGTYNVDGLCAVSSLVLLLKYMNADVEYLIYDRQDNEAQLNCRDILDNVDFLGAELLVTLGVGLKSQQESDLCRKLGIDLIVMENQPADSSKDYIYINPNQKGCSYKYKDLPVSAVTYKLMQAVALCYNMKSIKKYLDLIFIGIKWARAPEFDGENLKLIKEGYNFLINTNNNGLRSIIEFNNVTDFDDAGIDKIIESLIPPKGAVGITDNARIILELLTTNDKDRANQIVKYLNSSKKTHPMKQIRHV